MGNLEDKIKKSKDIPVDLTLREVIDTLAEGYRVETLRFVGNYTNRSYVCGLHIDSGDSKEILINRDLSKTERRETLIHEFYHALFAKLGKDQDEDAVERLAKNKYEELYERHSKDKKDQKREYKE